MCIPEFMIQTAHDKGQCMLELSHCMASAIPKAASVEFHTEQKFKNNRICRSYTFYYRTEERMTPPPPSKLDDVHTTVV